MTSYRYLGYGVTDSNGVAHLDHDPSGNPINGYTGTGAGEVDVIASTDNPITSSSIVSETYEVIDAHWYDDGVTDPKTVTWSNYIGNVSISSDGTTLERTTSTTGHYWAKNYTAFDIGAFAIEFDLVGYTDATSAQLNLSGTDGGTLAFKTIGCPQNSHFKLIINGEQISYQIDNGTVVNWKTTTNTSFIFGFRLTGEGFIKYRNFVVYPI